MKNRDTRGLAAVTLIAAMGVVSGCVVHTERTEEVTAPANVEPQQVVIVVPVPSPTPPPPPQGAPAPQPQQPNPTGPLPPGATPTAEMVIQHCSPWIPPDGYNCPKNPNPRYGGAMRDAIQRLQREQPQIFDSFFVRDAVAYYNGVFRNLYEAGYCAAVDTSEVAISQIGNNNYRENYHILSSAGNVRLQAHESACAR